MKKRQLLIVAVGLLLMVTGLTACHEGKENTAREDSIAMRKAFATSPVLSPQEAMGHFQLEKGFDLKLVASEPLVTTPVAISFDPRGRMWAVEMNGYMPDTSGTGENRPVGKIVILEDANGDGVMDQRKVFMDSLVMPRAICLLNDGILVAEPPKLWFVKNDHDKAGEKMLVDSAYAEGGNVEHQPNGLLRGLDNWIYNAKSAKRYRRKDGRWLIEHTHFRGQWGITQDDYGRLFYNNNSQNLLGDYFSPSLGAGNSHQRDVSGYNENIVPDNRTYPIRPTPGVNRGYMEKVLDDSLHLVHFTAACSPLIYRGAALGSGYENNAFVAEPSANLVKRNILQDKGYIVTGRQAYEGKEFLASTDERFRPVYLKSGPEGALYVVDMYRGVIQHRTYLTPYLKNEIRMRRLQQPLNCGRIYKILPHGRSLRPVDMSGKTPQELVAALDNPNSWVRETAQHLLTDNKEVSMVPQLRLKLSKDDVMVGRIHALWTLEGLEKLRQADLEVLLQSGEPLLQQQALTAAVSLLNASNVNFWLNRCKELAQQGDSLLMPYLAFLAAKAVPLAAARAHALQLQLAAADRNNPYVADAVISGLEDHEKDFLQEFQQKTGDTASVFYKHLQKVLSDIERGKARRANRALESRLARGKQLFETICQGCHGSDGNGIRSLGAPLNGSEWVTGDKNKVLAIVLYGLTGPVEVGGKLYKVPEVAPEMPGIGNNDELSDADIAQVVSFIRNSWSNHAKPLTEEDVKAVRARYKDRAEPFTMPELKK